VVVPPVQSEVDVLAQGRSSRWTLPAVPPVVRRLLLAVLVLAVVAGWLVDQRVRDREAAALDACAAGAGSSVAAALGPVRAMSEYVRPALGGADVDLRRSLYAMVGHEAAGGSDLAAAQAACRDVPVLAFHDDLRARRTGCELLLQQTADYLARVALDGRAAFRSSPGTSVSAAACAG
jgi:hypothetical protein